MNWQYIVIFDLIIYLTSFYIHELITVEKMEEMAQILDLEEEVLQLLE